MGKTGKRLHSNRARREEGAEAAGGKKRLWGAEARGGQTGAWGEGRCTLTGKQNSLSRINRAVPVFHPKVNEERNRTLLRQFPAMATRGDPESGAVR